MKGTHDLVESTAARIFHAPNDLVVKEALWDFATELVVNSVKITSDSDRRYRNLRRLTFILMVGLVADIVVRLWELLGKVPVWVR